jgi:phosphate:Na+ symporter
LTPLGNDSTDDSIILKKFFLAGTLLLLGLLLFTNPTVKEIAAGVAILLFGMIMLEEGFNSFASGPLQTLLKKSTDNLFKSISLGFTSTAILQSSSLISVIVISFISTGLLQLKAGIGIVLGANMGTTTTAWLVATLGLKINISGLAMPMLAFGIVLVLQKSKKIKGIGQLLAGLGFFFMGIFFMKNGFDAYKESINLAEFAMPGLKGLFMYTLIGILITVILQSSSATIALILTALAAGQITYTNSLALAIGANVGTTITAIIGSISSNIPGKRLAGAHFTIKVVTGLVALVFVGQLEFLVEIMSGWFNIADDNFTFKLSLFHTIFNVMGVLIFLPLINRLVEFLNRVFVEKDDDEIMEQPRFINKNSLNYPQTALQALINETKRLFEKAAFEILSHGLNMHRSDIKGDEKLKDLVKNSREEMDVNIDELYFRKVKTIYSKIIKYATLAQSRHSISEELTLQFTQIKIANRNIVEAIKVLSDTRDNINTYMESDNEYIKKEYDKLRKRISKVLRELHHLKHSPNPASYADKLIKLKKKAKEKDILFDGTLDMLIRDHKISSAMASSLANDSRNVSVISRKLIDAAELIYIQTDTILHNGDLGQG